MNKEFRERQLERFLSTITIDTEYGKEMYIRAFPNVPKEQNPGGGFIQVGCRTLREPIDNEYMNNLKDAFKKITGRVEVRVRR